MAENKSPSSISWWQSGLLRVGLTLLALLVSFLPRSVELFVGPYLGKILFFILSKREKIAFENIRNCFPELGQNGWQSLLEKNKAHYGVLVLELLHIFSPIPGHYKRYVLKNAVLEGKEHWQKAADLKKGVLFVSTHLANWEMMAAIGALNGLNITIVTKHLKPEWLHKKVEAARLSVQLKATYEPRTLPDILRALKKGESVGFVLDQYAGPPIGIPIQFFGVKVGTLAAVGVLAQRTGAQIIPSNTYRDEQGVIHTCLQPLLNISDIEGDEEKITQRVADKVEQWIRESPSQWLWTHRRFKNVVWPNVNK